jgi:hypothetical protein
MVWNYVREGIFVRKCSKEKGGSIDLRSHKTSDCDSVSFRSLSLRKGTGLRLMAKQSLKLEGKALVMRNIIL